MTENNHTDTKKVQAVDQAMGQLLKVAGPRVGPGADRAARVHASVRQEWQQAVKRKSTSKFWLLSSAAAIAATVIITMGLWEKVLDPVKPTRASLEIVKGSVIQEYEGQQQTLSLGDELILGATITLADDSGLALRLASNQSMRVNANSQFELRTSDEIFLHRGAVYVDSGPDSFDASVLVQTPFGVARDIGTQFVVAVLTDQMQVSVREGLVNVGSNADMSDPKQANAGEQLNIDRNGGFSRTSIDVFGEHWSWISDLIPIFETEGKTLAAFLEWVCRENGWTLQYTDDVVKRSAEIEILKGSNTEGMTSRGALRTILSGTDSANYFDVLDGGVLVVGFFDAK